MTRVLYTMTAKLGVTIGKCVHNTSKVKLHCKYNIVYRVHNIIVSIIYGTVQTIYTSFICNYV